MVTAKDTGVVWESLAVPPHTHPFVKPVMRSNGDVIIATDSTAFAEIYAYNTRSNTFSRLSSYSRPCDLATMALDRDNDILYLLNLAKPALRKIDLTTGSMRS